MDERLQDLLACPACRSDLGYVGKKDGDRLSSGMLICAEQGHEYRVVDEVPILTVPGTNMEGALQEDMAENIGEWIKRNFERKISRPDESPKINTLKKTIQSIDGIVLDIASGPGGSHCVPVMMDGRKDRLLVMSDLGTPVMMEWRKHLKNMGWDDRCSNLVFDARRIPFKDSTVSALTSIGGFDNIIGNKPAYKEAARVIHPGGQLLELFTLYQEGGKTQEFLLNHGQGAADWKGYCALLKELGFKIQKHDTSNKGRGKRQPQDVLPLENEEWSNIIVYASKNQDPTSKSTVIS